MTKSGPRICHNAVGHARVRETTFEMGPAQFELVEFSPFELESVEITRVNL